MSRARVLVTPRSLTTAGIDVVPELDPLRRRFELIGCTPGRMPDDEELLRLVPGCVGWLAGVERIGWAVLGAASDLRVISRNGTGTDAIDLVAAERAGVQVRRAAGANSQGVAELVLAVVLSALRHLGPASTALRAGRWERAQGAELGERTVGIIGLGAVGRRAATLLAGCGARVLGHDPFITESQVNRVDLDDLLHRCDVISLNLPAPTNGCPFIDADRLALMPVGTVLVNTARSALVDDAAVLAALEDGRLTAYAVDAFDSEPPEMSALLAHERVIATPHLGGYTGAGVRRATQMAVENLILALEEP